MSEQRQLQVKCYFCDGNDQQKPLLLRSLYRRFKRQLRSLQKVSPSKLANYEANNFKQLIKILFPSLQRDFEQCEHQSYAISFCNHLEIDPELFSYLCQRLSNLVGQTNYHLSLIMAQIKNVNDSLAGRKININDYSEEGQSSLEQKQNKDKRRGHKKVKGAQTKPTIQKQQQMNINSYELQGEINLAPLVRSQLSISSNSQQNGNQISYYFSYPIFFQTNSGFQ